MEQLRTLVGISVFWIGLGVVGDAFTSIVVVQRVAELAPPSAIATTVGLVTFAGILAGMAVQPLAGAISDRLRPRWGRRGQVVAGSVLITLALAAFVAAPGLPTLVVAFVGVQVAASIGQAAQQGFIPDLVEHRRRGRAAGAKGLADVGGAFLGFVLLALLAGGPQLAPAVAGVAIVVVSTALLAAVLVREPRARAAPPADDPPARGLPPGSRRLLVRVIAARFLFLLATFAIGRYLLLFAAERLGLSPAEAGAASATLFAALTLVTAVAALPAGWLADRSGRRGVMVVGAGLSAAGALLLLTADSWAALLLFGALMALGSAAFSTANWAVATDLVAPAAAGRDLGIVNIGTAGAAAVAGLFGFAIDATRGYLPGLGFAGLFIPAALLFLAAAAVSASLRNVALGPPGPAAPLPNRSSARPTTVPEATEP
jgi:MFS family permease